jgi:putative transposase
MPDHVQLLVEVDPQFGIHRLVRLMKGRSSHHLRQELPWLKKRLPTLWINSYFVSTVGGAPQAIRRKPKKRLTLRHPLLFAKFP